MKKKKLDRVILIIAEGKKGLPDGIKLRVSYWDTLFQK
ncbi:hypothetical protein M23134_01246 [Microscilla marina ATCC 23134]|uniref:Uncharacterized protein n=1 Tax=Microscilla marina ATCC 23134 TaxID=313606 RepID=A1ZFZ8_MICM2|nr:hypothetical protein M23134_01246 [Microscilla marina ATCC 23134]